MSFRNSSLLVNQFGYNIKYLQTDGNREYTSHRFDEFFKHNGIVQMISCPYTP